MTFFDLSDLGWSQFFQSSFDSLNPGQIRPARVVRAEREHYLLAHGFGLSHAVLAGKLRHEARSPCDLPVVGDWVAARAVGVANTARQSVGREETLPGTSRIEAVLGRRTLITRRDPSGGGASQALAANADLMLLAAGLDHDFNPRRLERGVALAREAGAEPVILLTKADLRPDCSRELSGAMAAAPGAYALAVSSRTGDGLDELGGLLGRGVTAVLIGSSGAGKSTLVNRLIGCERQRTARVRESDSRGRHATTHRELFILPGGGMLIDTPGLRAFGLTGGDGVQDLFSDVEGLAALCRFADCRHESEPGCAVKRALDAGELTRERYDSYLKLRGEAERIKRSRSQTPDLETKRNSRRLSKLQKRYARLNPKH